MNWISNVVRPKIRGMLRREVPENLWIKCPETGQLVFYKDVEANLFVIPGSNYHMRMSPAARLKSMFDNETWFDIALPEVPLDPLKFRDERRYVDRLKDARSKTGLNDAMKLGYGKLDGLAVVVGVQDFDFMGGSLGMAAGEAVIKGLDTAVEKGCPFVLFAASGGARMQEGILSLMQMPRTTIARAEPAGDAQALYRRAHQSDHRRRHRVLRHARRRAHRRARRADRLRRPARHRTDDPREAAGRVPARGISARPRHGRHGGASPRSARHHRPAVPDFAESAGRGGEAAHQPAGAGVNAPRSGGTSIGAIQARLLALHPKRIDLSLDRIERLLAALGHPERHLPPVIHVAGTNGKGSTIAFARAILEAAGKRVHVYTSPNLVRLNERFRIGQPGGGALVEDDELADVACRMRSQERR